MKKNTFENELMYGMQRELQSHEKKQGINNLVKAAEYINEAIKIFEQNGLQSQADHLLVILNKIACGTTDENIEFTSLVNHPEEEHQIEFTSLKDPDLTVSEILNDDSQDAKKDKHVHKLTPDKMVKNLLEHGTVFNMADDGKMNDLLDADIGEEPIEIIDDSSQSFEDSD